MKSAIGPFLFDAELPLIKSMMKVFLLSKNSILGELFISIMMFWFLILTIMGHARSHRICYCRREWASFPMCIANRRWLLLSLTLLLDQLLLQLMSSSPQKAIWIARILVYIFSSLFWRQFVLATRNFQTEACLQQFCMSPLGLWTGAVCKMIWIESVFFE